MASTDYFLKIDGIDGESVDAKHKGEIQIHGWSWHETNSGDAGRGGGMGAGKVTMADFNFVMTTSKASPLLFEACATGKHIPKAVLTCRKAGGEQQQYLTMTFSNLLISGFSVSGGGDVLPSESISFNFSKIELEYKTQDEAGGLKGSIKKGYDLKASKAI